MLAPSDGPAEEAPAIEPAPTTAQTWETAAVDDEPAYLTPAPVLGPRQMAPSAAARRDRAPRPKRSSVPAASAAAIALIALLAVNVLGLQLSVWSQLPALRGLYAQTCGFAGCDLPPLRSLAHIDLEAEAGDHRIGPPERLTLAATLVNRAPFRQPFPTVALRLLDAKGEVVARHRMAPASYLDDDAPLSMPPNGRTSIALQFDDPGAEAVRYAITLE